MNTFFQKTPDSATACLSIVTTDGPAPEGYELATPETLAAARAWAAEQVATGAWAPPPPVEPAPAVEPRKQNGATVIRRLTDAEIVALNNSTHPAAVRAKMLAMSEGLISEADPDFSALTDALDALGIIAASRWDALLAE